MSSVYARPYGRAWTGVRLRTPGPIAPVFQPCLVPARPVWKRGGGFSTRYRRQPPCCTPSPKTPGK